MKNKILILSISILINLVLTSCHENPVAAKPKDSLIIADSIKRSGTLKKKKVTPRFVHLYNMNQLAIMSGLYNPGKETQVLSGMLNAEVMHYNYAQETDTSAVGNIYSILATVIPFDSLHDKFKVEYNKKGEQSGCTVNGIPMYGSDANVPRTQFGSFQIKKNGVAVNIPRPAYEDLYEPSGRFALYESLKNKDQWFLEMWGSDGAGGYLVVWAFEKQKYIRRFVGNSF